MGNRDDEYDFLFKGARCVELSAAAFVFGFNVIEVVKGALACAASRVGDCR